jgi:hypothetical protein
LEQLADSIADWYKANTPISRLSVAWSSDALFSSVFPITLKRSIRIAAV